MWGLVLSTLTIGASILGKSENDLSKVATTGDTTLHGRQLLVSRSDRVFLSGVALGMGVSLFYNTVFHQYRVWERARLMWNKWWDWESKLEAPLRLPRALAAAHDEFRVADTDGAVSILVSSSTAATSTLTVSVMTLRPGHEMPSKIAVGVEFYYVLAGKGQVSQSGLVQTNDIGSGDCFIVDPGGVRWISNSRGAESLVLLRAADGGAVYSQSTFDGIRHDPNRRSSTYAYVSEGVQRVRNMANDYVNKAATANNNNGVANAGNGVNHA